MKKVVRLLIALAILLSLTACGNKTQTTVCTMVYEGIDVTNTIVSNNNKVQTITYENSIVVDESLISYLETAAKDYSKVFEGIKGVTYSYKVEGNTLLETTVIDYEKADFAELKTLGYVEDVNGKTPDYIDYELTLENMKTLGCSCTTK